MDDWIIIAVETIRGLGWIGPLAFALIYVVATIALIPGSAMTLIAGFIYGPILGTALVSPVSVLAATIAFLLVRTAFRHRIERRIRNQPFLDRLNQAAEESGFKLITLLRLSPVFPFVFLNYSLGLTRVRLRDYVLASFLGMFPATAMYVYIGSVAFNIAEMLSGQREATTGETVLYWFGLGATVIVAVLLTQMARRSLAEFTEDATEGDSGAEE